MSNLFFIISLTLFAWSILMLYRNQKVFDFRNTLRKKVFRGDGNWMGRYDIFSKVEYYDMVLKFWKPMKSFWSEEDYKIMTE